MMQTNRSTASRNSDVLEEHDDGTEISRSFSTGWIVDGSIQHSAYTFKINKSPGTSVQGLEENSVISTEINSPEQDIDNLLDGLFRISSHCRHDEEIHQHFMHYKSGKVTLKRLAR